VRAWSAGSVGDIDTVLHRLRVDGEYRLALISDPIDALAPYDLSADDLRRLDRALGRQAEPTIGSLMNLPPHLDEADAATT